MKPQEVTARLALGFAISACLVLGVNTARLNHRIDQLQDARLICHPIEGAPAGDRVCVVP